MVPNHRAAVDPAANDDFSEKIKREFCEGSAIAPALYQSAIEFVEDMGFWEPNRALNHHVSRFYETRRPHHFGAIALFRNEDGSYWQGKPETPRIDPKKGTPIRYETILGNGSRAYLPPVPQEIREAIGKRHGCDVPVTGSFWEWFKQHPEIPCTLTEGGKKSLSLLSQGYVAIALYGVNGGYRANEKIAGETIPLVFPELIDDLKPFAQPGRRFTLAFDQDSKPETRRKVGAALSKFGALLVQADCQVAIADWNGADGKGIDDLCVNRGADAVSDALQCAITFEEWSILRRLARRVQRTPDLNIGESEFVERVDSLPTSGIVALWGGKGTAKSKAIKSLLDLGQSWLSLAPLQSIARDQAGKWDGAFINDADLFNGMLLNEEGKPVKGASVCPPSLLKLRAVAAEVLILDELVPTLRFLLESKLANKDGIRPLLLTELVRRIQIAKLVVIADADMTEEVIAFVEKIRGEKAFLVRSDRQPLNYDATFLDCTAQEAEALFYTHVDNLPEGKVIYFNSDVKARVNQIANILNDMGIKTLTITQETSGGDTERSFLASKGGDLPILAKAGIRAILSSPSVTQGFSIEEHTDLIQSCWGIYEGISISADAIAQSPDRVRSLAPRFMWVTQKGRAYSRISRATTPNEFLREFKSASTATARLVRDSLSSPTAQAVDGIDWDSDYFKLLATLEAAKNKGMVALRSNVAALLKLEGKRVKFCTPSISPDSLKELREKRKEVREKIEANERVAIANAQPITQQEATALERKAQREPLSPAELHSLEKHYLSDFYKVDDVTTDVISFDRKGRTRSAISNLEAVLDLATATERTVKSIERNPSTPQDWNPAALRNWLLERTGALDLIKGICSGAITDLKEEIWLPVAQAIQQRGKEFKIAFKFSNVDKVSPFQAIATLLDWCGIKRVSHRQRVNGKITRSYSVDAAHLSEIKTISQRRSQADPPPPITQSKQGGGSLPDLVPGWDSLTHEDRAELVAAWETEDDMDTKLQMLEDIQALVTALMESAA